VVEVNVRVAEDVHQLPSAKTATLSHQTTKREREIREKIKETRNGR